MVKPPIQTPPAQDLFDPMGALEVTREAQPQQRIFEVLILGDLPGLYNVYIVKHSVYVVFLLCSYSVYCVYIVFI